MLGNIVIKVIVGVMRIFLSNFLYRMQFEVGGLSLFEYKKYKSILFFVYY